MKTVWESPLVVLKYATNDLPRHDNYPFNWRHSARYYDLPNRDIQRCYVHQKAGGYVPGFKGVCRTASFFVFNPGYDNKGRWTGLGRGWPRYGYTIDIPYEMEIESGRRVIYQCNDWETVSWHTKGDNDSAIAIGMQGYFKSRHLRRFHSGKGRSEAIDGKPSEEQLEVLQDLWENFLIPKFGFSEEALRGHFEAPKPKLSCPGDFLERWILKRRSIGTRRTTIEIGPTPVGNYELDSWKHRQAALVLLGINIGEFGPNKNGIDGVPGEATRLGIEAVERASGMVADGSWDSKFEYTITKLLKLNNITQSDIADLI